MPTTMGPMASHTIPHPFPNLVLQREGKSYIALTYAKFFGRPFTYQDLNNIAPKVFVERDKQKYYCLDVLWKKGLLVKHEVNLYEITDFGIEYLYLMASYYAQGDLVIAKRATRGKPHLRAELSKPDTDPDLIDHLSRSKRSASQPEGNKRRRCTQDRNA